MHATEPGAAVGPAARDEERRERNRRALTAAGLDALVCAVPGNVLLLSGYWPVVGTSFAVATAGGEVALVVPEDEQELARRSWADRVTTFQAGSLERLVDVREPAGRALGSALRALGLVPGGVVGFESGPLSAPVSYAAVHLYGPAVEDLLASAIAASRLRPARELLVKLRAALTPLELVRVREACRIAGAAYEAALGHLRPGMTETEVASRLRDGLTPRDPGAVNLTRAGGFAFCMSGPNAARAYAAYQISSGRRLRDGDVVLVHCNSYADGYWTDVTRTVTVGRPDPEATRVLEAVHAARDAALAVARPGVRAAEVDAAARAVMEERGLGPGFRHGLGHGVGFAAIDHDALPRLHPASPDVLETGMVFNIEPAYYRDGWGGVRQCDMVAISETGAELLTPFLGSGLTS